MTCPVGKWRSRYDGVVTRDTSIFDIDHLVALHEAWQAGRGGGHRTGERRSPTTLATRSRLIAASAASNRSNGDREPQEWMPDRKRCAYLKQWVAVKWRWDLRVNVAERAFLHGVLKACGRPRVAKPGRPKVSALIGASSPGGGGAVGAGGGCAPGYSPCIPPYPPDLDCSDVNGPIYVTGSDPHGLDGDDDGVACES